MALYVLGLLLL